MKKKMFATKVQINLFNEAVNKILWNNIWLSKKFLLKKRLYFF